MKLKKLLVALLLGITMVCIGQEKVLLRLNYEKGDVYETYADTSSLEKAVGFKPQTTLSEGIKKFISWYKEYYKI